MTAHPDRPRPVALDAWLRDLPHLDTTSTGDATGGVTLVDLGGGWADPVHPAPVPWPLSAPIVVGLVDRDPETLDTEDLDALPATRWCDVVLSADDPAIDDVLATVATRPIAARTLATLLRTAPADPIAGLVVESAAYSALQAGPEFETWRAGRPMRPGRAAGDAVRLDRDGDVLTVVLNRPEVRNALNRTMRDQLVDALRLAAIDTTIAEVHLRGAGPSFCSGGDLDEFGSFPDPATAHLVRIDRSAGRALLAIEERTTAFVHGHAVGSGIELPAFSSRVVADPDTAIALPELSIGLIPGAGGTVSLPRRIGRHRTALLALTGTSIDAHRAHRWGLVDEIAPVPPA